MNKNNLSDAQWQQKTSYKKAVLFNDEDFASPGTKLQLVKILPGDTVQPHYHVHRTEAFYILQGNGEITLDGHTAEYTKDDYVLCPQNTVHSLKNTSDNDVIIAVFISNDTRNTDLEWVHKTG